MTLNLDESKIDLDSVKTHQIPRPSKSHMELFKSIFDFHENYRAEKLISLLDIFHEMVLMVSSDNDILYANSEAVQKMKIENFTSHKIDEVIKMNSALSENILSFFTNTNSFYSFESSLLNSSSVPVNCDISLFELTSGSMISFWIIQDISEYKKIENSLEITDKKYKKILQETSDAVLILNSEFQIKEINPAGLLLLGIDNFQVNEITIFQFMDEVNSLLIKETGVKQGKLLNHRVLISRSKNESIMVLLNFRKIAGEKEFIVFMKDVSGELLFHQLMLRTIVNTQEKERERFSRDIHDDLGQQLSALKFNLSALRSYIPNEQARELLIESENILIDASTSVRSICFDLMPKGLQKNGLIETINELIRTIEAMNHVEVSLNLENNFPVLSDEINVALYRITQEFITNSIKHGKAFMIKIVLLEINGTIIMHLSDNGKGFDMEHSSFRNGNGIDNIISRAEAYNGIAQYSSKVGLGTSCEVRIPII